MKKQSASFSFLPVSTLTPAPAWRHVATESSVHELPYTDGEQGHAYLHGVPTAARKVSLPDGTNVSSSRSAARLRKRVRLDRSATTSTGQTVPSGTPRCQTSSPSYTSANLSPMQETRNGTDERRTRPCHESFVEAEKQLRAKLASLVQSKGALGRGCKALLIAFHQRTRALVDEHRRPGSRVSDLLALSRSETYVEFSAAYARSISKSSRYSVEQCAWPALEKIIGWRQITKEETKAEGIVLRRLSRGQRYGRHLMINTVTLTLVVGILEELLDLDSDPEDFQDRDDNRPSAAVEHVVQLDRMPRPRTRTVATKCPLSENHRHKDRRPSLIMWMNADGVTGGALCPVCTAQGTARRLQGTLPENASPDSHADLRQMTWRVRYLADRTALLSRPRSRRACKPDSRNGGSTATADPRPESVDTSNVRERDQPFPLSADGPVGGCVMPSAQAEKVGLSVYSAYVLAKLVILKAQADRETEQQKVSESNGDALNSEFKIRTIGGMSRLKCPMKAIMHSDRKSNGSAETARAHELGWYASSCASAPAIAAAEEGFGEEDIGTSDDDSLQHEAAKWLPTNVISVSAMRPSGWRSLFNRTGREVKVPSGWEPSAQAWIMFDFDDVENLDESEDGDSVTVRASEAMCRVIRRCKELSGVCIVMQSGPRGLHVWAKLREVRRNPREWFGRVETRTWYHGLGQRVLKAAHKAGAKGGHVDMASCAAGRFGRRPGWRILPNGEVFRSRLTLVKDTPVRGRAPRINAPDASSTDQVRPSTDQDGRHVGSAVTTRVHPVARV